MGSNKVSLDIAVVINTDSLKRVAIQTRPITKDIGDMFKEGNGLVSLTFEGHNPLSGEAYSPQNVMELIVEDGLNAFLKGPYFESLGPFEDGDGYFDLIDVKEADPASIYEVAFRHFDHYMLALPTRKT